ncbi:hypothetical protein [Bradyrhizobium sp.]|uniref:hypothetical protein n=1 Tax=Bradyrhizobium sp. TaxID=376 RepID=UPI0025B96FF7|nr:hypothetical protein [Bradyrhizobium sp.]
MKRWLWIVAAVLATLWSLLAWGTYALVGAVGGLLARNADWATGHPETVVWLSWLANLATGLGLTGVVLIWVVGLIAIAIVAPLLSWLWQRRSSAGSPRW